MTKGKWEYGNGRYKEQYTQNISTEKSGILFRSVNMDGKVRSEEKANAKAIVTAVNNTYGKGIDPEAVPEMIDALKYARRIFESVQQVHGGLSDSDFSIIETALKKAGVQL